MKFFISIILLVPLFFANAQNKIEADFHSSVDSVQSPKIKIISCGGSIYENDPLFIIDGIPFTSSKNKNSKSSLEWLSPNDIVSISVLKGPEAAAVYGSAGINGVVIINTKMYVKPLVSKENYPFKFYDIKNVNWTIHQDMYNTISANVPGVEIKNTLNTATPEIRMRGDDNTIVIVDGIRYDASILNTLNPSDIESVKVSNNTSAQNYFINN